MSAPEAPAVSYTFVKAGAELLETSQLSPVAVTRIRELESQGQVTCPTCTGRMRIALTPHGTVALHIPPNPYAHHEPDDLSSYRAKRMLGGLLRRLFPSAQIDLDVGIPEVKRMADAVIVTPRGGRIAIEYQSHQLDNVQAVRDAYHSQGIRCLWLLDERLLVLAKGKKQSLVRKADLQRMETALISHTEPLLYLDVIRRRVLWLHPHPDARELAQLGEPRLGKVECLLRSYPLAQLRVREGRWWVPTNFDTPAPAPGALSAALQKKLTKRRAQASLGV